MLNEQIKRKPKNFPKCTILNKYADINNYSLKDILIEDYKHHSKINMEMKV